jgi:transposase
VGAAGRGEDEDRVVLDASVVLGSGGAPGVTVAGQEAFLEAHVFAFERLGGIPTGHIRYDNLKPAVSRVFFGRARRSRSTPR